MRTIRPLRLETLEDRTLLDASVVTPLVVTDPTLLSAAIAASQTTAPPANPATPAPQTGAFIGGLITPVGTTPTTPTGSDGTIVVVNPTTTPDGSAVGGLVNPIGTPVNP